MVNGFEMIYRFVIDPKNYFTNLNLFIETELPENKRFNLQAGCSNTDNKGNTTRGAKYVQGHLKKLRNTLNDQTCIDAIKGNVANPEDFFRQANEKRHTSTAPIYLTSVLILESTKPDDLVVDIWNGVSNTAVSALLLGRKYLGIEKEDNYFKQSCRRMEITEEWIKEANSTELSEDHDSQNTSLPLAA